MFKKTLFIFLFGFLASFTQSQQKKILISGKITDSLGILKNVNIINLKTKQGTFSNNQGLFRIFVSKEDTLRFSSVQHQIKNIKITEQILDAKKLNVTLNSNIYTLDEFDLKRHNLQGILSIDVKGLPKNKRDSILKENMSFSKINLNDVDLRIDDNIRAKPPIPIVDPNKKFEGVNLFGFLKFNKKKRLKRIVKDNFDKELVPEMLLNELGKDYFFNTLKIPKQKYNHFLEYCDLPKIISLHKKDKLLDIIQIFQNKSKQYLKIKKD